MSLLEVPAGATDKEAKISGWGCPSLLKTKFVWGKSVSFNCGFSKVHPVGVFTPLGEAFVQYVCA